MIKIKQIITGIIAICLVIPTAIPTFAETKSTDVSFVKEVGFIVTIPEEVAMVYDEITDSYSVNDTVSIEGAVKANEIVSVSTDSSVTLYDGVGGSYVANSNIGGDTQRDFSSTEICNGSSEGFGVSTTDNKMPAGTWTGLMYFNINYGVTEDLQLSANKLYLGSGSNYQLDVTSSGVTDTGLGSLLNIDANAADTYTWSSSDPGIVSVTNTGFVSVKYAAESGYVATVTASNGFKSATCDIAVTGITFNEGVEDLSAFVPIDSYYQVEANVIPSEAQGLITYSSNKRGVNIDNRGKVYVDPSVPNGTVAYIAVNVGNINKIITLTVGQAGEHTHTWNIISTTPATCTVNGSINYSCSCGETKSETILATDHTYVNTVIASTCYNTGYTTHTCSVCGESYNDTTTAKLTHSYTSVVTTPATCLATGVRTYTCSKCGNQYTNSIAILGHTYTSAITTPTSCSAAGVRAYTCSRCGDTYTSSITKLAHTIVNTVVAPTCTEAGCTKHTCSVCGYTYNDTTVAALGHSYTSVVTTSADYVNDGVRTYTCSRCGDTYTVVIPKLVTPIAGTVITETINSVPWSGTVLSDGTASVSTTSGTTITGDIIIPDDINGLTVTDIGDDIFLNNLYITSVVIPNTVTNIGYEAFRGCENITSITLPESLKSIEYAGFAYIGVETLTLPSSLETLGTSAFYHCDNLTSIVLPSGLKRIEDRTFAECYNLRNVNIPSGVTYIGYGAFNLTSNLKSIILPNGLTTIGERAFGDSGLESIIIPNTVASIGEVAFIRNIYLKSITWSTGVTEIPFCCFYQCTSLTSFNIPSGVTSIKESAFNGCLALPSIIIPTSVKTIGNYAFANWKSTQSIKLRATSYTGMSVGTGWYGAATRVLGYTGS